MGVPTANVSIDKCIDFAYFCCRHKVFSWCIHIFICVTHYNDIYVYTQLPSSLFQTALEDISNGVYFGWAVIESASSNKGRNIPIKAVVNVGYSPTFEGKENKEKIVEAHLITTSSPMEKPESTNNEESSDNIDEIEGDFYGETLRLQLIGYLRAEQKFDSFPELIAQIHRDIGNANWALDSMPFVFSKEDSFIKDEVEWIGSSGGDGSASWEYETW